MTLVSFVAGLGFVNLGKNDSSIDFSLPTELND